MKNLNKAINAAVVSEIDRLLQPFHTPTTVWEAYFCTLEDLQREFPAIDRWRLRVSLAIQVLERNLVKDDESEQMRDIYDHAIKEQQAQNWRNMKYTGGEMENITNC